MNISYSRLRVDTLLKLAKGTIETSEKPEFASIMKDHLLLLQLKISYAIIFSGYNSDAFGETEKIVYRADLKRDRLLRGILGVLKSMSALKGTNIQNDADELLVLFNSFGTNVARFSYDEESVYLNELIETLDKPETLDKLEKLNLKESFELLKQSQIDFENLFFAQVQANAILRNMQSASSLKLTLIRDLRNFLNVVDAMRNLDTWKNLYHELTELIMKVNIFIAVPEEKK
jgi:hypothetical protein